MRTLEYKGFMNISISKLKASKDTKRNLLWKMDFYRNGHRIRRFFDSRTAAEQAAVRARADIHIHGHQATAITDKLRRQITDALEILSPFPDITLPDAAKFYATHHQGQMQTTMQKAFEEFLAHKKSCGLRPRSLRDLRLRVGAFVTAIGPETEPAGIAPKILSDWIFGLPLAPQGKINFRRTIHSFFQYCKTRGYTMDNPAAGLEKIRTDEKTPGIFRPDQVATLLAAAAEVAPDTVPFLAIGFFAGLRTAEILRLDWRDVRPERKHILVGAGVAKTRLQRLVDVSENLSQWLLPYRRPEGKIAPGNLQKKLTAARQRAGITTWPGNVARHSYASFHLAMHQDAAATALQLGHGSTVMLFRHYRALADHETAEKFFSITPTGPALAAVIQMKNAG